MRMMKSTVSRLKGKSWEKFFSIKNQNNKKKTSFSNYKIYSLDDNFFKALDLKIMQRIGKINPLLSFMYLISTIYFLNRIKTTISNFYRLNKSELKNIIIKIESEITHKQNLYVINYEYKVDPQFLTTFLNNSDLISGNQFKSSGSLIEINKNLHDCYKEFKIRNKTFFYLNLEKIKNNDIVEVLSNFSSYLFLNSLKDNQSYKFDHKSFSVFIAIVGIDKYLKNMDELKKAEILDYLAEFHRSHIGGILFYGCSRKVIEELSNRKCKIENKFISDEIFKEDFCNYILLKYKNFDFLSTENLELIYKILGNKPKRLKKFFSKFERISKDPMFKYNNFYIKSQIREIFHHKDVKLKNKLHNFDLNFFKTYKSCEKFTKNPELLIEGNNEICLLNELYLTNQLIEMNILEQIDDYYIYSDSLTKFFCQDL